MTERALLFVVATILGILLLSFRFDRALGQFRFAAAFLWAIVGFAASYWAMDTRSFHLSDSSAVAENNVPLEIHHAFGQTPSASSPAHILELIRADYQALAMLDDALTACTLSTTECDTWEDGLPGLTNLPMKCTHRKPTVVSGYTLLARTVSEDWDIPMSLREYVKWHLAAPKRLDVCELPSHYYWIHVLRNALDTSPKDLEKYIIVKQFPGFVDFLYFSIVSITTTGYGDITPTTTAARCVVSIEILAGVLLLGLFLNELGRRFGSAGKNM